MGRLQDASLAVQLLLAENGDEAADMAQEVESINRERKKIVSEIVKEAEDMANPVDHQGVIVVAKEGWNEGVLGIVASNLVRKYDRPAIVLSVFPERGEAKGSARSIPAFDLFSNCMKIRNVLHNWWACPGSRYDTAARKCRDIETRTGQPNLPATLKRRLHSGDCYFENNYDSGNK